MRLIEILPFFPLIRRIIWEKPGLNYLETCDLVRFIEELGKLLLYACKDFFLSGATSSEQGMIGSLISLSGAAPQVTMKS